MLSLYHYRVLFSVTRIPYLPQDLPGDSGTQLFWKTHQPSTCHRPSTICHQSTCNHHNHQWQPLQATVHQSLAFSSAWNQEMHHCVVHIELAARLVLTQSVNQEHRFVSKEYHHAIQCVSMWFSSPLDDYLLWSWFVNCFERESKVINVIVSFVVCFSASRSIVLVVHFIFIYSSGLTFCASYHSFD